MSVQQLDVVDYIGSKDSGSYVLAIADELGWDDVEAHLRAVERKVALYLRYIASGDLFVQRPREAPRTVTIAVYLKFPAPGDAYPGLSRIARVVEAAGIDFEVEHVGSLTTH